MTTQNKVSLYIATHNTTGLKYFGMTRRYFTELDLQENYFGSGTYWKQHLEEHGKDVTMEIFDICDNLTVADTAISFSTNHNIIESYKWANLCIEDGLDGGCIGVRFKRSKESVIKNRLARKRNHIVNNIGWNEKSVINNAKIIMVDGVENTNKAEMLKKSMATKSKIYIGADGNETTINKEKALKMAKVRAESGNYHPNGNRTAKNFLYVSPEGIEYEVFNTSKSFCIEHKIAYHLFTRAGDGDIITAPKYIKSNTPESVLNTVGWKRSLICDKK